jgi:hypothetical protein
MFKRSGGKAKPPLTGDEIENMQALALLAKPFKPELRSIAAYIRELAEKKDPWVRKLKLR